MASRRLKFMLWSALCALIFVGASSIEQTVQAVPEDVQQDNADIAFVFDLNGVLFDTSRITVFRQLGIKDVLWYLARYRSPQLLKKHFYETLHRITDTTSNLHELKDSDGAHMPRLMAEWLSGTQSNNAIVAQATDAINAHPEWFMSATEQRLMKRMVHAVFNPKKFVESRKLLPDLIPLIMALKKRGTQLYVLSNWDKESFVLLKEKYSDLFNLFDGCIISGDVGHVKPQADIFSYLKAQLSHHTICFLDDQHENLNAGKAAGLHTILVAQKSGYLGSSIDTNSIISQSKQFLKKKRQSASITTTQKAIALS